MTELLFFLTGFSAGTFSAATYAAISVVRRHQRADAMTFRQAAEGGRR